MKLEVNISKKYFFSILAVILIVGAVIGVVAYNSNPANPSVFGHSANEIEGLTTGSGISFISPVVVYSKTSAETKPWTTFDASSYIPEGTSAVLLEIEGSLNGPDGGDTISHVRIRKDSSSDSYLLIAAQAAAGGDQVRPSGQGMYPIANDRSFQYTVESPGFNLGVEIRLVGYVK